jgi:hypothetical protein
MKDYLENPPTDEYNYIRTWTTNPENWKAAPIISSTKARRLLIYVGSKRTVLLKQQIINFSSIKTVSA